MNKEVYYEGWLIKSPPTKRIWRARWRRRWFTLKQGEIPEQFCLEYYADRKCRKLKGVIDLDQCEQVDCGLRLENRKQKFQFMFDIKTPKRTYYLAADTEQDMRDWVNCICQVCHLHDTKQQQDENCIQNITATTIGTNSSNDTTTTTLNTSTISSGCGGGASSSSAAIIQQNTLCDVLRKSATVIDQQPTILSHCAGNSGDLGGSGTVVDIMVAASVHNNNDTAYINTEYTNRETLICDAKFEQQQRQQQQHMGEGNATSPATVTSPTLPVLYLNAAVFQQQQQKQQQQQQQQQQESTRLAVSANGVVRKIPENLILNNTALTTTEQQQSSSSVQPSPALSTASGPYIPISECFSGSPKFMFESNNPTTPLNNLDPKFYDTPRSHNNIGLNLTNDQSYSPKITNCGSQQPVTVIKNRNQQRSDSDSESVFTDDDEWTHPLPLREHLDRNTRPSDSSVENESFVLTYSQRFSKLPEDILIMKDNKDVLEDAPHPDDPEHLTKVLKNKNNLVLDIRTKAKESEKIVRDLPQLSDTENTSPAFIGPKDAKSVVEESYDIPRSHQLPYYNISQLLEEKLISPTKDNNPIAASTPNLANEFLTQIITKASPIENESNNVDLASVNSASTNVRTLPRAHCYTNAAPTKIEGNVFRYDFIEQSSDVPPVNRKLKPKTSLESEKVVPTDVISDLPVKASVPTNAQIDHLNYKVQGMQMQCNSHSGQMDNTGPLKPPSVDRKSKPNVFKIGQSNTLVRRSTGAYSSMMTSPDTNGSYSLETHTLPRHPRPNYAFSSAGGTTPPHLKDITTTPTIAIGSGAAAAVVTAASSTSGFIVQHQRTPSANAVLQLPIIASTPISTPTTTTSAITTFNSSAHTQNQINSTQMHHLNANLNLLQLQLPPKNEHKLQYFDLDVANAPAINRQSLSTSNLNISGNNRLTLSADPSARPPMQSGVVYNSVDFVKTEAFKRIREERKKENEGVANSSK